MGEMEGGFYYRIMSTRQKREGSILPVSYQQFLWQGTRCFQKVTPEPKSCDLACFALASVVREGKDHPSLKGLKAVSRKVFIEAAIPYVTQACAAMLSKRQRISRDRLSPSVIKLLSTLHWILLESPLADQEYQLKYETIEAFVKEIVPCVEYVDVAKDLVGTGDLRRGAEPIWDCLQRHVTPDVPPLNYLCRQDSSAFDTQSSISSTSGVGVERVSVFDIAVVRALGTTSWPDRAVEWALKYLSLKLMGSEQKKRAKRWGIPDIHISTSALGSPSVPNQADLRNTRSQSVEPSPVLEANKAEENPNEKAPLSRTVSDNSIILTKPKIREQLKQHGCSGIRPAFIRDESSSCLSCSSLDRQLQEKKLPLKQQHFSASAVTKDDIDLSYYLASDSRLSIPAIFEVITYQLLWGQSGFSSRVYEEMLNLMRECLSVGLQNFLFRRPVVNGDTAITVSPTSPPPTRSVSWNLGEEVQFLHKALWTTLLLLRHLGCCEHGCKYGIKGRQGRRLHALASQCLSMIARHNLNEFKKLVRSIVIDKPLSEVFSCFHAFFCFCTIELDKTTLQNCVASSATLQGSIRTDEEGGGSFSDVHGVGMGDVQIPRANRKGNENIEVVMAKIVLSHLVSRMMSEDMKKLNNLGVAQQFCLFITYLNSHHEALLRRVSFAALVDGKLQKQTVSRTQSGTGQSVCEDSEASATCNEFYTFQYPSSVCNPSSPLITRGQSGKRMWKRTKKLKSKAKLKSVSSRRSMDQSASSAYLPGRRRHISFGELDPLKAVDLRLIRYGVRQFSLLLGCSELGALPSGNALAAVLDLDAPVLSRAALLLECSLLIHKCRDGQLTVWMCTSAVRNSALAVNIWNWGLALGNKLSEILQLEKERKQTIGLKEIDEHREMSQSLDDDLRNEDGDKRCPVALRMICCQLLLEITAFLRECPQIFTRRKKNSSGHSARSASHISSMRTTSTRSDRDTDRLLSRRASHMHPSTSASPVFTEKEREHEKEREMRRHIDTDVRDAVLVSPSAIGMLLLTTTTSLPSSLAPPGEGRRSSGTAFIPHKGGTQSSSRHVERMVSFSGRRPSMSTAETEDVSMNRRGSKFSNFRNALFHDMDFSGNLSDGSDDDNDDYHSDGEKVGSGQSSLHRSERENFPWMSVIAEIINGMSTSCDHEYSCEDMCVRRQKKRCLILLEGLEELYKQTGKPAKYIVKSESKVEVGSVIGDIFQFTGQSSLATSPNSVTGSFAPQSTGEPADLSVPGLGLTVNYDKVSERYAERGSTPKISFISRTLDTLANLAIGGVSGRVQEENMHADSGMQPRIRRLRMSSYDSQESEILEKENKYNQDRINYIRQQVTGLCHCGLSMFIVAAPVLPDSLFQAVIDSAWKLLLDSNREISSSAACVFLLASAKLGKVAESKLASSLDSPKPLTRLHGIARFAVLWENRYQVWPRMEKDAQKKFKVPPLNIGFTLPSPPLGSASVSSPDSSWAVTRNSKGTSALKKKGDNVEPVRQDEEQTKEESETKARQTFRMCGIPFVHKAGIDSAAVDTEGDGPPDVERSRSYALFPAAIYSAIPLLIQLLDDAFVGDGTNTTVAEAAQHVIWKCLVEEPSLFFRPYQERAIKSGEQAAILQSIRRLLLFFPTLPPTAAHFIYNHMMGVIMYYTSGKGKEKENSQEILLTVLSVMWQVVPSVKGLSLKMLKDFLKREQCDVAVLVNARQSAAKELSISFDSFDDQQVRTVKTSESDWTFKSVLEKTVRDFNIQQGQFFLEDWRTSAAMVDCHYVGDHYFHRRERGSSCHLRLVPVGSVVEVEERKQRFAVVHSLSELARVLHADSLITNSLSADPGLIRKGMNPTELVHDHLDIVYGDLSRQWSFPRKALDSNFELYSGISGRELYGVDLLHKQVWVEFIWKMFKHMPDSFPWGKEAAHFLNVINGTILLHCEDQSMLRLCLSTLLGAIRKFTLLFPRDGYAHIIPTLLRVYAAHSTYNFVVKSIEFFWVQCFSAHGSQFVLEMLSAAAPLLVTQRVPYFGQEQQSLHAQYKVLPVHLYSLLNCLEAKQVEDVLLLEETIAGNNYGVKKEKESRQRQRSMTSDSLVINQEECDVQETADHFTMDTALRLIVSVIVFDAESLRASQMLYLLDALMPYLLSGIDRQKTQVCAQSMQILIKGCASLKETYQRSRAIGGSTSMLHLNSPFAASHTSSHTSLYTLIRQSQSQSQSVTSQSGVDPSAKAKSSRQRAKSLDPDIFTRTTGNQGKTRFSMLPNIPLFSKTLKRGGNEEDSEGDYDVDKQRAAEEGTLKGHRSSADDIAKTKSEAEKRRDDRLRMEFRESRDSLLSLASEFICHSLKVLSVRRHYSVRRDPNGASLLLGSACHSILAAVANSLLKLAPFDPPTMACSGLKRYMLEFLPSTAEVTWYADFTDKGYQEAMYKIIRRLLKIFQRLNFKLTLNWDALSALLKGPYLCLQKQPALGHLPPMRELIETVVRIVTRIQGSLLVGTSASSAISTETVTSQKNCTLPPSRSQFFKEEPPPFFCESVVRLVTMLMMSMKDQPRQEDRYSLEKVCGNPANFGEIKSEPTRILRSLLLPLCIRLGCGRSDWPRATPQDVRYAVTCLLHTLLSGDATTPGAQGVRLRPLAVALAATSNAKADQFRTRDATAEEKLNEKTAQVVFHGLKIITACFEKQLSSQWHQIACAIKQFGRKSFSDCLPFWKFLEYLAKEKGPLFVHLKAFIKNKVCHASHERSAIALKILQLLNKPSSASCHGSLLQQLACELARINELKVPEWDADTTDIVSIAALQAPPKRKSKRVLTAVSPVPEVEEAEETDLDSLQKKAQPRPLDRWRSDPGPSGRRSVEVAELLLRDSKQTVRAEIHHVLSPVREDEPYLLCDHPHHKKLPPSPSSDFEVRNGAAAVSNGTEGLASGKDAQESGKSRDELGTNDITVGANVVHVNSPTASVTSTTCTSGHGSSDESDILPYGAPQTEGLALQPPTVCQPVSLPSSECHQSDECRHMTVVQQDSRRRLVKQEPFDIPDSEQPAGELLSLWEGEEGNLPDFVRQILNNPQTEESYV